MTAESFLNGYIDHNGKEAVQSKRPRGLISGAD